VSTFESPSDDDWVYNTITEASKNARTTYFLYLTLLAFCVVTLISTTDRFLVLNESIGLPLVNAEISMRSFLMTASIALIGIFVHLQLNIDTVRSRVESAQAQIDVRRIYPWIVNSARFESEGVTGWLRYFIVSLTLWISLPFVIALFAIWSLKTQDGTLARGLAFLFILAVGCSVLFWYRFATSNREKGAAISFLATCVVLALTWWMCSVVPNAIDGKVEWAVVDLSQQILVKQTAFDAPSADLHGRSLNGANLRGCLVKRCD
jgi:hypothetical protein